MNKTLKLSAMAVACAFFTILTATSVQADELLITSDSDQDILISDTCSLREEELWDCELLSEDIALTDNDCDIPLCEDNDIALCDDRSDMFEPLYQDVELSEDLNRRATNKVRVKTSGRQEDILNPVNDNPQKNTASLNTSASRKTSTVADTKPASDAVETVQVKNSLKSTRTKTISQPDKASDDNINTGVTDTMKRLLDAVNEKRAKAGVGKLVFKDDLNYIASLRVKEASRKYSHTRENGNNWVTILTENNVAHDCAGENLARCMNDPEQVVAAWSLSPSHNRCMLNGDYTHAGVGTVTVNGCTYWTLTLTD